MHVDVLKKAFAEISRAAIEAVDPYRAVRDVLVRDGNTLKVAGRNYDLGKFRKVFLLAVGKAGQPMARAAEEILGERLESGLAVVKSAGGDALRRTRIIESGHPEPDRRGLEASRQFLELGATRIHGDDLLLVLISGGGSALLPAPVDGLTLEDKQAATRVLLRCGATIQEINAIRKHLSRIKGGRLLRHTGGCRVIALMLSDVVGDDMASIASGPTSPDPTSFADCLEIVDRYRIRSELPAPVVEILETGARQVVDETGVPLETPKPGDPLFERVQNEIVAGNFKALKAAAERASELGYRPLILSSSVYGNTPDVARFNVAVGREILRTGNPLPAPCCVISGGETTLKVRGDGKGGRNQEYALWCARETDGWGDRPILFASLGTDGSDGPTDAAGAFATPMTAARARRLGLSVRDHLERNDSYHFFKALGDLIVTGDTRTNVMDLQLILVERG